MQINNRYYWGQMNFLEAYYCYINTEGSAGIRKSSWPAENYFLDAGSTLEDIFSSCQEIGDMVNELEADDWVVVNK